MVKLSDIRAALADVEREQHDALTLRLVEALREQGYAGRLNGAKVAEICGGSLSPVQLAFRCLALAACYAVTPISNFKVGAVAIGRSGAFYFGANQEFNHSAIQQTIHAEQSAITHAWEAGEAGLTDLVVNTTPCGHCRQFINELNTADSIRIHLPHSQNNLLHQYLPDAFGPKNLNIRETLFDPRQHFFSERSGDRLVDTAIEAAQQSYAPYSRTLSAVALQRGDKIFCGRYAENAAFNPSMLPLQSALNYMRLSGLGYAGVDRLVMAERKASLSHRAMTEMLAQSLFGLERIEYVLL
ncbi:cytidine deaminase [Mesocricetibacter intestinalis]|uniref:Cytidine deaminase n=1 Tax=Mesocricetibacter intestinalis TaxID=1521930 RepID=A0A4R6V9X5_9PAST|nr:cytidine deaminase [Mesocricetibacter intestinalis]TDQ56312.1 cytidine deaminase [Mesocricetibacter intestinalis]